MDIKHNECGLVTHCSFFIKINGEWVHDETEVSDDEYGFLVATGEQIIYQSDKMGCTIGTFFGGTYVMIYGNKGYRTIPKKLLPAIALQEF